MTLAQLKKFPAPVWVVLVGTFLTRGSFFMVWPFMAVILHRKFGLSEANIGAILSATALSSAIVSFYVGYITDKVGRKGIIMLACLVYVVAFVLLAFADVMWLFAISVVLVGLSRAMLEPPARAMISDLIADKPIRELAHHVRYYMINVGGALGPILGLQLGLTGAQSTFGYVAVAYALWGFGFVWVFTRVNQPAEPPKSPHNIRQTLAVLGRDRAFLLLVIANALVMYCYMHQETSLVQYLNQLGDKVVEIYTPMLLINALVIVIFQFPLLKLLANQSLLVRVQWGLLGFGLAFFMYGSLPLDGPLVGWYIATVILSLGEVILFPTFNLLIDRLAPAHMRGTYFGASGIAAFGVSMSPFIGGLVLQFFGGPALFFSVVAVLVFCVWLYRESDRQHRKTPPPLEVEV